MPPTFLNVPWNHGWRTLWGHGWRTFWEFDAESSGTWMAIIGRNRDGKVGKWKVGKWNSEVGQAFQKFEFETECHKFKFWHCFSRCLAKRAHFKKFKNPFLGTFFRLKLKKERLALYIPNFHTHFSFTHLSSLPRHTHTNTHTHAHTQTHTQTHRAEFQN